MIALWKAAASSMTAWRELPNSAARPSICRPIRGAAREVTLALRAREVTLKRPKRNHPADAAHLPKSVTLTLVDVREIDITGQAGR